MNKKIKLSIALCCLINTSIYAQTNISDITVYSATKSEQSLKDLTSNISIITKEDIEEKNYTTVSEALNTLSGVSFTSNGGIGASTSLSLRGLRSKRILILVDGVRFQDPSSTSGANIAHLMINDIERIEVIKGAQSGIWGAEASAGVINIISKKAKEGTHGSFNAEYGTFNTKKIVASISHKVKNFDIKLNASKITSNSITSKAVNGVDIKNYENDAYENTTFSLSTNYYINDDARINFNIKDINAVKDYDYSSPNDTLMKSDIKNKLYSLIYSQKANKHNLSFIYELAKFKRHEIGTVGSQWGESVLKFNGENSNIEIRDNLKYSDKDFLIFGLANTYDKVDYILTNNVKTTKKSKNYNIYLTNSNTFDKLILTQSIRYDKFNNFDNALTGKFAVKYNLSNDISFSSNLGNAYNVPSIIEELNPWGAANFDLQAEKTKSYDFSIDYKNLKLTVFKYNINNLIAWQGAGYSNIEGKSKFKGYEIEYSNEILEDSFVSLNYTKTSAKKYNGKNLAKNPKNTFKTSFDYYGISNVHVNINAIYTGERYSKDDNKGRQTGKYTVLNTVLNYEINDTIETYLKINNITDKYYQTIDGYATEGRSAYIGLKASF